LLNRAEQTDVIERRALRWYIAFITLLFGVLIFRLLQLQVVDMDKLRLRSINNILQAVPTPAPRGNIYDRSGKPLAVNETVFRLLYKPPLDIKNYFPGKELRVQLAHSKQQYDYLCRSKEMGEHEGQPLEEIARLAQYLNIPYPKLMFDLERELRRLNGDDYRGFKPATLVNGLSFAQVAYLEEHRDEYQGIFIDEPFERQYKLGEATAHLLGYTGYASDHDPDAIKNMGFTIQEKVGKDGLEMQYEAMLHGEQGRRNIWVDPNRVFQEIVSEVPPVKGTDLYLTIDAGVQQQAWNALNGMRGAMIVMALMPGHEGEVVSFVSSPSFDPTRINESEYYAKLNGDKKIKPMTNRAYRGVFVPGSTFKLVSSTALLTTGTVNQNTSYFCGGKKKVGNRDFHCHVRTTGHGYQSVIQAIAHSCDVYFYSGSLAMHDAPNEIAYFARQFGYGEPSGIDLPWESKGVVPDTDWWVAQKKKWGYTKAVDLKWYPGNSCNYIIGQGDIVATPLQVLMSAAMVAWRGERWKPHLLLAHSADTKTVREKQERPEKSKLDPKILAVVEQGMRAAVKMGTGRQFDSLNMGVCSKTGTAENRGNDHAWVVGYYPVGAPRYAFVCLVEHGGHGAETAVPAMKQVLSYMKSHEPIKP
jgi:penicillin-binding protein 2